LISPPSSPISSSPNKNEALTQKEYKNLKFELRNQIHSCKPVNRFNEDIASKEFESKTVLPKFGRIGIANNLKDKIRPKVFSISPSELTFLTEKRNRQLNQFVIRSTVINNSVSSKHLP